jgi:hypothetical protein
MTDSTDNERRAFLLGLDPATGQRIATQGGFVPPSQAVALREQKEIMKQWMTLDAIGVVNAVEQYLEWYIDITSSMAEREVEPEIKEFYVHGMKGLMVSMLLGLKRAGHIVTPTATGMLFEIMQLDPDTMEPLLPDMELEQAIQDLEFAATLPDPDPFARPPLGEAQPAPTKEPEEDE